MTSETNSDVKISQNTALELDFPIAEISQIAEQESWRKEVNRPIYHIHKWWANRLGSVFRAITLGALSHPATDILKSFYKQHNLTGKVVLDPFMGSGTTLGEAVKLGAKAIGCDINPVSTFLVQQAFTRVSESKLRREFCILEKEVSDQIKHYYQTRDPHTGHLIPVLYFFWVKTVTTPSGETLPLLSRYVFSQDAYPKKKPKAQIICPNCWGISEDRYDTTELICLHCTHHFNPQKGPASGQLIIDSAGNQYRIKDLISSTNHTPAHRLYAILALRPSGEKVYLPIREEDLALYEEAQKRLQREDLPLPTLAVRPGHNTDQARGYHYIHWRDFFNSRQLLCLGLLLRSILTIKDELIREQLLCLFSSTLEFNNIFCSFKGEGTGAVRPIFSNHILKPERTPLENSVWGTDKSSGTFCTLFESRLIKAKRYLDEPFEVSLTYDLFGNRMGTQKRVASAPIHTQHIESWEQFNIAEKGIMILNGNSASLPLPASCIDAVITDPPYFDFVHYSELSDFFFAWLAPILQTRYAWFARPDSSNKGEVQHNDPMIFAKQLSAVFTECHRVLKDEGVLAFSFHHSRAEGWAAIYEAITNADLAIVAAHPIHAELRAANPKSAAKSPISLDAILVCKKRSQVEISYVDKQTIIQQANELGNRLQASGMIISASDRFVILASQLLIACSKENTEAHLVHSLIQQITRQSISNEM